MNAEVVLAAVSVNVHGGLSGFADRKVWSPHGSLPSLAVDEGDEDCLPLAHRLMSDLGICPTWIVLKACPAILRKVEGMATVTLSYACLFSEEFIPPGKEGEFGEPHEDWADWGVVVAAYRALSI